MLTYTDVTSLPPVAADLRVPVGSADGCFGDLYLPAGLPGPHPTIILIHGGCWRDAYDLTHVSPLADALRRRGWAVWSVEYRRVGMPDRRWYDTLQDVAAAADLLPALAETRPLDLARVVALGHSAGGHLAFWLATRGRVPAGSPLHAPRPLPLRAAVGLAPIPDLAVALARGICGESARLLLKGTPQQVPRRYAAASPAQLLPPACPTHIIAGQEDEIVPLDYLAAFAGRAGATLTPVADAGHFELIMPGSVAWQPLLDALDHAVA